MAQHPLQQRIAKVAAKARRMEWYYALSLVLATLVGAVLVWGAIDAALHVQEAGVRTIASLTILLLTGWAIWKFGRALWRVPRSTLAVAQRIEQHFPMLGDRLSSSLAFLQQDEHDLLIGSAALRRATVAETMSRVEGLNFADAIDPRTTRRALAVGGLVLVIAGTLAALFPAAARLVIVRTLVPWTTASWPRRNQLKIEAAPQQLATGGDFEVVVGVEKGELPDQVHIVYQFADESSEKAQTRDMKLLDRKMVHRLEGVTRSFRYRAYGGDDDSMPWQELTVVEPPHIASLDVRLIPPAYTGWPSETATPDFRALEGTQVELRGTLDQPIASAALKLEEATTPASGGIAVGADGLNFAMPAQADKPWLLAAASGYALELTNSAGLKTNSQRYDLRVLPDRPPSVQVEQPADNTTVTPTAQLPLRVMVKDDLAIAKIELKYLRSDQSEVGEQTIELFAGPAQVEPVKVSPLKGGAWEGESRPVTYVWNLGELANLAPGITLTWHVASSDYKPQTGVSPSQRITIISAEELEDRIAQRQNAILMLLGETLRKQQKTRGDVTALNTQLDSVGRLGKRDLDQLQSVELEQRQVQRSLLADNESVLGQVKLLTSELASNRVDSPAVVKRMAKLAEELKRLGGSSLPVSERELNGVLKIVRDDLDKHGDIVPNTPVNTSAKAEGAKTLAAAGVAQDETIASLERLLGDLEEFDNYRRFAREVSRLKTEQQTISKETTALQPRTLSKSVRDLAPQELADLKNNAQQQTQLARQLDKLIGRMAAAQPKLADSQPVASSTLADALAAARRAGISSQMLDAAKSIEQNQIGNAGQQQQELAEALRELTDILSNRAEHELARRAKQLRESAAELSGIQEQLKGLQKRTADAAKIGNAAERNRQLMRLSKEAARLKEEEQRLARKLERLESEKAGAAVGAASSETDSASQASQQGAGEKALENLAQAKKQLDDAQQKLQQDLAKVEQDLFLEQVGKLEQAIAGLVARQQTVVNETARLEGLKLNQQGEFTPSQRTSVRSLSEQQRDLSTETTSFAQQMKDAAAFGLALQGAVREMTRAAGRLDRALTDKETQGAEQVALARLQQVVEALKPEPPMMMDEPPPDMPPPMDMGNKPPMPPGEALHLLAELKLLKLMQQEINRRTEELEQIRQRGAKLSNAQEQELSDLAVEQGKLAELVLVLGEQAAKQAAAAAEQQREAAPPDGKNPPKSNNGLGKELEKSLDNELLPGSK